MRNKNICIQISAIEKKFNIEVSSYSGSTRFSGKKENCINLFVVNPDIVSTKDLFQVINLGCMNHNSWFLDQKYIYDIVSPSIYSNSNVNYILDNVNITNTTIRDSFLKLSPNSRDFLHYRSYDPFASIFSRFDQERPLTFHEVLNLAFQYPRIFNEKIKGIQSYGSRYSKNLDPSNPFSKDPTLDDTLEIYSKGNLGNAFLKMAREKYRYQEDAKIIPFIEF